MPTSVSYIFLYVYELLSGVGADDPLDGLNKLVTIWTEFMRFGPALENYLPRWFKDYHIYYEMPHSFEEFVIKHDMKKHYPQMFIFDTDAESCLGLWNCLSSYDITKSKFFSDGNERIISDCLYAVVNGIRDFCMSRDARLEDLLIYRVSNKTPWYPFRQALFQHWLSQSDRKLILPGEERYFCQNNRFTASLPIYYSTQKDFIGYIIKKTESCLRHTVKYKYKLAADKKPGTGVFRELKDLELENADLDRVIENTVVAFYRDLTRTVVTVDQDNLARIRKEALGIQDKLVVPEDDAPGLVGAGITDFAGAGVTDSGGADVPGFAGEGEVIYAGEDVGLQPSLSTADYTGDPWDALKNALDDVEKRALATALLDSVNAKAIAVESGIMLEVLADGINEKAADYIGDSILEVGDGLEVYDDYKDNIRLMLNDMS